MNREIFINSLPVGSSQRNTDFSRMTSIIVESSYNVFIRIFEKEILMERDIDNPNWNPIQTLEYWIKIFGIREVLDGKVYSNNFLNYITRFYNRLLISRPAPISMFQLNELFLQYEDFGLSCAFTRNFTLGVNELGDGVPLGISSQIANIIVDETKKYSGFYYIIIKLVQRVLFINSRLIVTAEFKFVGYPPIKNFIIIHDCELPVYFWNNKKNLAEGNFSINKNINVSLAQRNFLVENIIEFPIRDIFESFDYDIVNKMYTSFFILNIDSVNIKAEIFFINTIDSKTKSYEYELNDMNTDIWSAILIKSENTQGDYKPFKLRITSDKRFYIDQVRININDDTTHTSYPIVISSDVIKIIL